MAICIRDLNTVPQRMTVRGVEGMPQDRGRRSRVAPTPILVTRLVRIETELEQILSALKPRARRLVRQIGQPSNKARIIAPARSPSSSLRAIGQSAS
jgi:uncharacterized protein involved in exopolysaccharide biosynthesis